MGDFGSEAMLAFAEPSSISSRQFLTQHYTVPCQQGVDYWFAPQTSANLELSGMSQNTFILPQTMKLEYQAIGNVQLSLAPPAAAGDALPYKQLVDVLQGTPATPFFGAPHLGSVLAEVPGLSSDLGILTSNIQSQRVHASRLLCSGGHAHYEHTALKPTFAIEGRTGMAGAKGLVERVGGVVGSFATNRNVQAGGSPEVQKLTGSWVSYAVPASAWFLLANQTSCALPLAYLTAGSSNLVVRVNWAPADDAVFSEPARANNSYALTTYWTTGVQLSYTAVNILDARVLRAISALFTGQMSIPVAQGVTIPVPMVLGYRAFKTAVQSFTGTDATVTMRVPAGVACAEALMIRLDADPYSSVLSPATSRYLLNPQASIEDLRITIGSALFPARALSDIVYEAGSIIRGTGTARPLLFHVDPANPANALVGTGATRVPVARTRADEMYELGRQFFSLWSDDDYTDSPMTVFQKLAGSGASGADAFAFGSQKFTTLASGDPQVINGYCWAERPLDSDSLTDWYVNQPIVSFQPNVFVIPLNSFVPESSPKDRAFGLTGIDLRNQADIQVSFRIKGISNSALGIPPPVGAPAAGSQVPSWTATAVLAYSELASLLPSRTDLRYSMSALPSAAGSVTSGGLGTL